MKGAAAWTGAVAGEWLGQNPDWSRFKKDLEEKTQGQPNYRRQIYQGNLLPLGAGQWTRGIIVRDMESKEALIRKSAITGVGRLPCGRGQFLQ